MLHVLCNEKQPKSARVSLYRSCQTDRLLFDELLVIRYCSILIVLYLFPYGDPAESQCNPTYVGSFLPPVSGIWACFYRHLNGVIYGRNKNVTGHQHPPPGIPLPSRLCNGTCTPEPLKSPSFRMLGKMALSGGGRWREGLMDCERRDTWSLPSYIEYISRRTRVEQTSRAE